MTTVQAGGSPANPMRIRELDQDFAQIITTEQYQEFQRSRWPEMAMAIPLANSLAVHERADLLERAKGLANLTVNDEGEDGLVVMLQTIESAREFCTAQAEILRSIFARLMIVADDILMENGDASAFAGMLKDFDPLDWIRRANEAGASMFVRDDELWIGSVIGTGRSALIDELRAELDDDAKVAVREVLAARGLVCAEG